MNRADPKQAAGSICPAG